MNKPTNKELEQRVKELEKTVEELQESEKKSRQIYKGIPVPLFMWEKIADDFVLVDYNDVAVKFTHSIIKDLKGQKASEMYKDRPDIMEDLSRCFKEKISIEREISYRFMTTGEIRNLAVTYVLVPPDMVMVYSDDITERKRVDEDQVRLAAMLDATPGFAGYADAKDTHILNINSAGRKMVGIAAQEDVTQLKIADVHPEWTNKLFCDEIIPTAIRDGMWTGECAFLHRDGHEISVMMVLLAHKSPSGEAERFSTISIDITEQKRIHERYRAVIEASMDGFLLANAEGNILDINESICSMLGYSREEMLKMKLSDIEVIESQEGIKVHIRKVIAHGSDRFETKHRHKDGSVVDVELMVTYLKEYNCSFSFSRDITERKKMEEALRQSEEKFRSFMETANEFIYITDEKMNLTYVNDVMTKTLGYSKEELTSMNVTHLLTKKEKEKGFNPRYKELVATGRLTIEDTWITKDKKEINGEISAVAVYDNDHNFIGARAIFHDITERKQAEEKIKSLARFPDENPNPILRISYDNIVLYANNAASMMLQSLNIAVNHPVPAHWHDWITQVIASQVSQIFEMEHDGRIYLFNIVPIQKNDYINIYANDITERRNAEEKLKESEKRLRLITETIDEVFWMADVDINTMLYVSPAFERIWGISVEELCNNPKSFIDAVHPDDKNNMLAGLALEKIGKPFDHEYRIIKPDGEIRWIWDRGFPIYDKNGQITFYAGIAHDITERKRLEEQLQIRQRMDSLGTLAGGIAHDFNNLLAGIMGNIDMLSLESEGFSELQKEYLKYAMINCERAAALTRQFQTLSQSNIFPKTSVDVYEIASEVFNLLGQTTDKLIEKRIDFKSGDFQVTADPSELNQVFLNLGTNALHAIEERGVKKGDYISIRAEDYTITGLYITQLPDGEYVHILFEDNGIGMSDEVKSKAFDPLFTTKEKGKQKGQGLGLAMVYNIITRKHGGYITIESTKGKGTTFHIYLPKASAKDSVLPEKIKEIAGGNETILVIDDEEMIVNLAKSILEKWGYKVLTAPDGRQGLDMYIEKMDSIDLVLLDLTMPEMSGRRVFEEMLLINPAVRIIISSGHSEEDTHEGILLAAKGHVQKPYKVATLAQTVRTVLDS